MRGLLIYDNAGAMRNSWFIDRLISCAKEDGCELELVITDQKSSADDLLADTEKPDFAIVRTISPELNRALESRGIRVFNNSLTAKVANDKMKTHFYSVMLGIPAMETKRVNGNELRIPSEFPKVIKSVDGHGGSEVFLVKNAEECKEILSLYPNKHFIAQDLSSEPGIDMRVYVLGGKVLAAVKRTSKSDFRSNFSLGGNAEITSPPNEVLFAVKTIATSLEADFIGVDFIRHEGEWVLNEIEDVVGTRMLYSLTDIDAADLYIKHVISKVTAPKK